MHVCTITRKTALLRFEPPLGIQGQPTMIILGSLGSVVNFLLVLINFLLVVTAEMLRANMG